MTLTDQGMAGESFGPHQLGSQIAVADVGGIAIATDGGGVAFEHTYVVQQGRLFHKGEV